MSQREGLGVKTGCRAERTKPVTLGARARRDRVRGAKERAWSSPYTCERVLPSVGLPLGLLGPNA